LNGESVNKKTDNEIVSFDNGLHVWLVRQIVRVEPTISATVSTWSKKKKKRWRSDACSNYWRLICCRYEWPTKKLLRNTYIDTWSSLSFPYQWKRFHINFPSLLLKILTNEENVNAGFVIWKIWENSPKLYILWEETVSGKYAKEELLINVRYMHVSRESITIQRKKRKRALSRWNHEGQHFNYNWRNWKRWKLRERKYRCF